MNKLLAISVILMTIVGCKLPVGQETVMEGTSLQIGLYIPISGQLYGLQCLNYLSGRKIQCPSNTTVEVNHCFTNSSWTVDTAEKSSISIGK